MLKTRGSLTIGNGLSGGSFDGSGNTTITVSPVSGSPITVGASGVGMSTSGVSSLTLAAADELIISQGGIIGKTTVQDVLNLVAGTSGAPTSAAYLVASSEAALSLIHI